MRKFWSVVLAATLILAVLPFGGSAHAGTARPYALALGDSLAAGFQPDRGDSRQGYAYVLRGLMAERIDGLRLRNVGCDGETSRALITGNASQCSYPEGSQLGAALAFLGDHPGEVAYITIDVGMNDVFERCLEPSFALPTACVREIMPKVQRRLGTIVDALSAAAGPGVPIAAMTYYDPLLGLWGLAPGGRALAQTSLRSFHVANAAYAETYADEALVIADVASTFRIDDTDPVLVPGRGPLPRNVARTCRWTWFCYPDQPGDFHPNTLGYRQIAHTFARALRAEMS